MPKKTLKFREDLVKLILKGEKNATWRPFDDKNLQEGDIVELINWNTTKVFGNAKIINIKEKKLGDIKESDFDGHEKFENGEEMYRIYRTYYGDKVNQNTIVKIINFELV